jgi:hypothetical protein
VTLQSPPAFLQGGSYSALADRLHINTINHHKDPASTFRALQGFFPDRYPTYSNPSGMNWSVGPCAGIITNTFVSDGGDYAFANPTNLTGSFAASSPTLNRYDILGLRVRDNFYDSSGFNDVTAAVIQGTNSAGTPVDPTLPSSFIPIARAVIPAASTSPTLQDLRVRTVNSAALLPVDSATARTALGTAHSGFGIWRTDTRVFELADGAGAWRIANILATTNATTRNSAVSSPYTGQHVWQDDGAQHYFRDSDAVWKPTKVLAGRVLTAAGVQVFIGNAAAETNMAPFQMTVNLVAGRRYRVTASLFFAAPTGIPNSFSFKVRRNTVGGTLLTEFLVRNEVDNGLFDDDHTRSRTFTAPTTESLTLLLTGRVAAGTGNIQIRGAGLSQWWIEDVGSDSNFVDVP